MPERLFGGDETKDRHGENITSSFTHSDAGECDGDAGAGAGAGGGSGAIAEWRSTEITTSAMRGDECAGNAIAEWWWSSLSLRERKSEERERERDVLVGVW